MRAMSAWHHGGCASCTERPSHRARRRVPAPARRSSRRRSPTATTVELAVGRADEGRAAIRAGEPRPRPRRAHAGPSTSRRPTAVVASPTSCPPAHGGEPGGRCAGRPARRRHHRAGPSLVLSGPRQVDARRRVAATWRCPAACADCFEDEAYFREVWTLTRERLAALRALRVVVLSRYMRDELVAGRARRPRASSWCRRSCAGWPGCPPTGLPCVLFVGPARRRRRRVRTRPQAWRDSGLDAPLVVAGAGPLRPDLERRGAEVLGWVDRGAAGALYFARAGAVVMASRWQEPFGIVGSGSARPAACRSPPGTAGASPSGIRAPGSCRWGDIRGAGRRAAGGVRTRAEAPAGFRRAGRSWRGCTASTQRAHRMTTDGARSTRAAAALAAARARAGPAVSLLVSARIAWPGTRRCSRPTCRPASTTPSWT